VSTAAGHATVGQLIGKPVRVGSLDIGIVDDVVFGADLAIVLGVVVVTHADRHCFLPWVATGIGPDGAVEATATTTLLGELELDYYLRSGTRLSRVVGLVVDEPGRDGTVVGDVMIAAGGRIEGFVVAAGEARRAVPLEDTRIRWSEGRLLELSVARPAPGALTSNASASRRRTAGRPRARA